MILLVKVEKRINEVPKSVLRIFLMWCGAKKNIVSLRTKKKYLMDLENMTK